MSKRIVIVTDNLSNQINGVVTTYRNLCSQAKSHGYEIDFLSPDLFPHFSCPGYPEVKLSWPRHLGRKLQQLDPDHVHIATEGPLGLAAKIWLDRHKWNYNTSYHTKFPEFLHELYCVPASWTYGYVKWFHQHSGKVLTTTQTMVQDLQRHGFAGEILPWTRGVDRNQLKPTQSRMKNSKPVVLNVGRVSREKGLDSLCALSDCYHVVIVGDGPDRARLEKQYPAVHFVGYKSGSDLANYYQQADVFCFTSQVDTFGIVMIESMSMGTPVAAYPVPGPVDVVESGVNGHLDWDLSKAIAQCLSLNRQQVTESSEKWTWKSCWMIFQQNLVPVH